MNMPSLDHALNMGLPYFESSILGRDVTVVVTEWQGQSDDQKNPGGSWTPGESFDCSWIIFDTQAGLEIALIASAEMVDNILDQCQHAVASWIESQEA